MRDHLSLDTLRQHPTEWHRRGMTSPAEIDQMVAARLGASERVFAPAEPSYADFFVAA